MDSRAKTPRCIALVGPHLAGKTTLLESILAITGRIPRKGKVAEGTAFGDASPEARQRLTSVELACARTTYLGDEWIFIDTPGSIELEHEARQALMVADAAVVVCEPTGERTPALAPLLHFLDERRIPHVLFLNKMDATTARVRELLQSLQTASERPLVLREVPLRDGERVSGLVDLVSERAWKFKEDGSAELVQLPPTMVEDEKAARRELLEHLADFDDKLLEQLLEDATPTTEAVFALLAKELHEDAVVPVLIGSAEKDMGVQRLLKMLRHEVPFADETARRLGIEPDGEPVARVFKTRHVPHVGKLSLGRVFRGEFRDGMLLAGAKVSGLHHVHGTQHEKTDRGPLGDVVALGRMELVATGQLVSPSGRPKGIREDSPAWPTPPPPVYGLAITAEKRGDDVKITSAVAKLVDEDPSLVLDNDPETHELVLRGQGELQLQVALSRLRERYHIPVRSRAAQVPYKETIRKPITHHARYKKQTGGHGQFADVVLEIRPQARGQGFAFDERVVGGAVPRNYIPAVEEGVRDYLARGPLGYPVVDVAVTLLSGAFHSVDSSDQAFRQVARLALAEAMPQCGPVLLEPILAVEVAVPSEMTPRAQRLVTGRRGQILGHDTRPGWPGWDVVSGYVPQAEMHDFIMELRSLTLGLGTFTARYDHLAEVMGKQAERVLASGHGQAAAQQ
ncbi:MAG TPA: elongation factor G [Myxococcaceae bacterium]|nr:elongation factor G [Myxococcaceae bacterium]